MFDELFKQAQRLFSSKNNGGQLVSLWTDRLHSYKLVFFALSLILMLGSSQFREHFKCEGTDGIDSKQATSFCLVNGTTTVVNNRDPAHSDTHAGMNFVTNERDQRVINHNYMRSLWALLLLLSLCSYFARKSWAALLEDEVLQAILKLSDEEKSPIVKAAEEAKPYKLLSPAEKPGDEKPDQLSRSELVSRRIDLVNQMVIIHDHSLDYYPNQLTYLLLTKDSAAYKLSCLKLRSKLIFIATLSTVLTAMQFQLPLIFIGNEYLTYGWKFFVAFWDYVIALCRSDAPIMRNSIDYELSATIFPTLTQCEYYQYAMTGAAEKVIIQCAVPINEICAKLFTIVWWAVVINIVIELCSLTLLLICSVNVETACTGFSWRFWPNAREQADLIASFRFRRSEILRKRKEYEQRRNNYPTLTIGGTTKDQSEKAEAASLHEQTSGNRKRWYHYTPHEIVDLSTACCRPSKRDEDLRVEPKRDINIYYLLYLIHLRLGKSASKTEQVIRMTSGALNNYLDDLRTIHGDEYVSDDDENNNSISNNNPLEGTQQNVYAQLERIEQIKQQQIKYNDPNLVI